MRIVFVILLCTVVFFSIPVHGEEDLFSLAGVIKPRVRVDAPGFTLEDLKGVKRSLQDYRGKVILINFWATWCGPCREEMPSLERLWQRFRKRGLVVIAIAADRGSMHMVERFCAMHRISFPVFLDPTGRVRRMYEVSVLPTSYIIGRDGKITGRIIGERRWDGEVFVRLFESLLE